LILPAAHVFAVLQPRLITIASPPVCTRFHYHRIDASGTTAPVERTHSPA
jgi:hypothetical protein